LLPAKLRLHDGGVVSSVAKFIARPKENRAPLDVTRGKFIRNNFSGRGAGRSNADQ
jgi:hypothetical protein